MTQIIDDANCDSDNDYDKQQYFIKDSYYAEEIEEYLLKVKNSHIKDKSSLKNYMITVFCFNDKFRGHYTYQCEINNTDESYSIYFIHHTKGYNELDIRDYDVAALFMTQVKQPINIPQKVFETLRSHNFPTTYKNLAQSLSYESNEFVNPILKYFEYSHLPPHLQEISKPICDIAKHYNDTIKDSPEKSAGLRKLLEAKDCLVRAALEK